MRMITFVIVWTALVVGYVEPHCNNFVLLHRGPHLQSLRTHNSDVQLGRPLGGSIEDALFRGFHANFMFAMWDFEHRPATKAVCSDSSSWFGANTHNGNFRLHLHSTAAQTSGTRSVCTGSCNFCSEFKDLQR